MVLESPEECSGSHPGFPLVQPSQQPLLTCTAVWVHWGHHGSRTPRAGARSGNAAGRAEAAWAGGSAQAGRGPQEPEAFLESRPLQELFSCASVSMITEKAAAYLGHLNDFLVTKHGGRLSPRLPALTWQMAPSFLVMTP